MGDSNRRGHFPQLYGLEPLSTDEPASERKGAIRCGDPLDIFHPCVEAAQNFHTIRKFLIRHNPFQKHYFSSFMVAHRNKNTAKLLSSALSYLKIRVRSRITY